MEITMNSERINQNIDRKNVVIVLDSNQIINNWFMNTPRYQHMLDSIKRLFFKLIIPQVVFEEVISKYNESLRNLFNDYNSKTVELNRLSLGNSIVKTNYVDLDKQENVYREFLIQLIKDHGKITPYKDVKHENIVFKAIKKQKPFKQSGDGYRDALIWECIKKLANEEKKTVVFITGNSSDFSTPREPNKIHEHLLKEIDNPDKFYYFVNVQTFLDNFLTKQILELDDAMQLYGNKIENWLKSNIYPIIRENKDWGHLSTGLAEGLCDYFLKNVAIKGKPSITESFKTIENHLFIRLTVSVKLDAVVNVDYEDYRNFVSVRDWLEFEIEPYDYMAVDHREELELDFALLIDTENIKVMNGQLVKMIALHGTRYY